MRLEAIEKEADLYKGKGECYVHAERTANSPIKCVMAGDRSALAQVTYSILVETARQMEITIPELLKLYKKAYKQFGIPEKEMVIDE
ncbi:MAG: hypothetical protein IJH53_04625 [Oscillospiraceae bacterium]|nr:hypothetical protein [Oscillospiraceae bacterium]